MRTIDADALLEKIENPYERSEVARWVNAMPLQPEIITCAECKYAEIANVEDSQDGYTCQFHRGSIWFSGSYCSWAKGGTSE